MVAIPGWLKVSPRGKVGALSIVVVLLLGFEGYAAAQAQRKQAPIQLGLSGLKSALQKEGFDDRYLERIFSDGRLKVDMNVLRLNIFPSEKPADYKQFLTTESLQSCKRFLQEQRKLLEKVKRKFGVEEEIITAVLLVESRFGKYVGRHRVFNVYSSLVMADTPENITRIYRAFNERYPEATLDRVRARVKRRANWAFRELVYLLQLSQREGFDVMDLKGSWAGAFGLPQFLPSSFFKYAVDGNEDHRVDLYDISDTVASVGNYLKSMGWRPGISRQRQKRLIRTYNNSGLYADTILRIAAHIKK
ncbi:MAG: lytic murein transglycosylase [Deltaproteobacteria bacterium]|nr:lytic murein transglycosylase [Deltaproteobacteria bacterium]MBW2305581.1 lytic murein transglycosylase [Deltaproteobacteria bacterium]